MKTPRVKAATKNTPPELLIYDEIGPSWAGMVSAESVTQALKSIGNVSTIVVRINSPGGDVFEGFAIYNVLRRTGAKIVVEVDGLAASAASLIAMAGDKIRMAQNSMMMIHNSWIIATGNRAELAKTIGILEKVDANLRQTYAARTGLSESAVGKMLDAETWLTADEALEKGFADEPSGGGAKSSIDRKAVTARLQTVRQRLGHHTPETVAKTVEAINERLQLNYRPEAIRAESRQPALLSRPSITRPIARATGRLTPAAT